jgi:hypothetical protein
MAIVATDCQHAAGTDNTDHPEYMVRHYSDHAGGRPGCRSAPVRPITSEVVAGVSNVHDASHPSSAPGVRPAGMTAFAAGNVCAVVTCVVPMMVVVGGVPMMAVVMGLGLC